MFNLQYYLDTLVAKSTATTNNDKQYWEGRLTGQCYRFNMTRLEMLTAALNAKK